MKSYCRNIALGLVAGSLNVLHSFEGQGVNYSYCHCLVLRMRIKATDTIRYGDGRYEGNTKTTGLFSKKRVMHGSGTYFYNNGDKYIGRWSHGVKDGKDVCYNSDGSVYEQEWLKGKLLNQNQRRTVKPNAHGHGVLRRPDGESAAGAGAEARAGVRGSKDDVANDCGGGGAPCPTSPAPLSSPAASGTGLLEDGQGIGFDALSDTALLGDDEKQ